MSGYYKKGLTQIPESVLFYYCATFYEFTYITSFTAFTIFAAFGK